MAAVEREEGNDKGGGASLGVSGFLALHDNPCDSDASRHLGLEIASEKLPSSCVGIVFPEAACCTTHLCCLCLSEILAFLE